MASRTSTPSRSRSSSNSSSSSDTTMIDAPPQSPSRPARLRNPSHSAALPTPTASQMPIHQVHPDPSFSLLLSLPRELRDRVYTYALVSQSPFLWPGSKHQHVSVNLLRTSRQVHDEAVDILYAQNKFLFSHPSDCNIFRVVTSRASVNITSVYFRIKDRDLPLWTSYMGSRKQDRSLRADLPKLKSLWVFLRLAMCPHFMSSVLAGSQHAVGGQAGAGGVQAVQNAMGQQIHALQQQVQNAITQVMTNAGVQIVGGTGGHALAAGNASQIPPPPPPAPAMPFPQFMQGALGLGGHAHQAIPAAHAHGQHNHPPNPSPLAQHLQAQQNNPTVHVIPTSVQQTPPATTATSSTDTNRLYASLIRSNRFKVVESLCLQLQDTLHPKPPPSPPSTASTASTASSFVHVPSSTSRFYARDPERNPQRHLPSSNPSTTKTAPLPPPPNTDVKIVCIARPGKRQIERLLTTFPDELEVDPVTQDARTRFREIHGVEVGWEFNGLGEVEGGRAGEVDIPWDGGW